MSPSKFEDFDVTKSAIYNQSSTQFRINKASHSIQKPGIGNSSPRSASASKNQNTSSIKRPVIIYTHPPEIIKAEPHEFMSIVQRLTGLNRSEDEKKDVKVGIETIDERSFSEDKDFKNNNVIVYEENESSSVLTDEKYVEDYKFQDSNTAVSPMYRMSNQYTPEVPLFSSPSASDQFLCSSTSNSMFYDYPNMSGSFSPSFMDYDIKGFPDY